MGMVIRSWRFGGDESSGSDPYYSSTVLLLSGDGANGSTTFHDESFANRGNATVDGDTQVVTAVKVFGTGSGRHDGSSDVLRYGDHADWNFAGGDFTIEGWFSLSSTGGNLDAENVLICQWNVQGNQRAWQLVYSGELATNALRFFGSSAGTAADLTVSYNWTPTADQFYFIALDRSGNDFRLYIDGVNVAKVTQAITLFDSSTQFRIGARLDGGGASTGFLKGGWDEIRITKGVARYASDSGHTVPTEAFPRS